MRNLKPIPGFKNYSISDDGVIISHHYNKDSIRSLEIDNRGYYVVRLWEGRKCFKMQVHRLVWKAHKYPIKATNIIHHKDHDKLNNQIENLELTNRSEHKLLHPDIGKNTRFQIRHHLDLESLMNDREIMTIKEMANKYGCSERTISRKLKVDKPLIET